LLGPRPDLMLLTTQGRLSTQHDGHLWVRTTSNPAFRLSNFMLLDATPTPGSRGQWVEAFKREFPSARYVAIGIGNRAGEAGSAASCRPLICRLGHVP